MFVVQRDEILSWLEGVHHIWNLRDIQLYRMRDGRVGVFAVLTPDSSDHAREHYKPYKCKFYFDLATTTKWDVQYAVWRDLEALRKAVDSEK